MSDLIESPSQPSVMARLWELLGGGAPQPPAMTGMPGGVANAIGVKPPYDPTGMQQFLGYTDPNTGAKTAGWGGLAVNAASGAANTFLGMKQYGLAKDSLKQNKREFEMNFDAQKKMTNSSLEDRQRARVASSPGSYQSVSEYMSKYGV